MILGKGAECVNAPAKHRLEVLVSESERVTVSSESKRGLSPKVGDSVALAHELAVDVSLTEVDLADTAAVAVGIHLEEPDGEAEDLR